MGGDFREATYRAVRQGGLKEAQSILLEPYYSYQLEVPTAHIGRAIIDLERLHATYEIRRTSGGDLTVLSGRAPVVMLRHYQREVTAYTGGNGRIFCSFEGYGPVTTRLKSSLGWAMIRNRMRPILPDPYSVPAVRALTCPGTESRIICMASVICGPILRLKNGGRSGRGPTTAAASGRTLITNYWSGLQVLIGGAEAEMAAPSILRSRRTAQPR